MAIAITSQIWSAIIETPSHCPVIHKPGRVKARPPAIMAPADIPVCAMFISLRVVFPRAFSKAMESTAPKIVGQGSALILRATYIELAVIIPDPSMPIRIPLRDK